MTAVPMTETIHADVAIVGGGPVGLGLAIGLGQLGVRVTVIERYEQPQPIPKGQNLTTRTMEHFHFWGCEPELRAARTIPRSFGMGGMTAYGTLLGEHHYDWMQREIVRPFYFQDNERLPQYATEAVLRARAAALPGVTALYGWTAKALTETADGVSLDIEQRGGGDPCRIVATYVAGCDGSRSFVRETAGITQTRNDHDRLMVLLVFRSEGLDRLLRRHPGKSFFNVLTPELQGYWKFFGRVDANATFFFHAPVPVGTTRENLDFMNLLHESVGAPFDVEMRYIGFWDLRFAVADTYRKRRLFIAGDAAHSHPPYGGYGINTGFEDVANLAWKLAATLKSWAGPALLDSYSAERQPVFASTARDFIARSIEVDRDFVAGFHPERDPAAFMAEWTARKSGARAEVNAFEPHYEGSPVVLSPGGGTASAVGAHMHRARAGHHLSPFALPGGGNVYDNLGGGGFTLLDLGADPAEAGRFAAAAARHGVPLRIIAEKSGEAGLHYESPLVLVRPDQYVAWSAGETAEDADEAVARASGH
jgi:4-hydroxyisophthalate hydroxylase